MSRCFCYRGSYFKSRDGWSPNFRVCCGGRVKNVGRHWWFWLEGDCGGSWGVLGGDWKACVWKVRVLLLLFDCVGLGCIVEGAAGGVRSRIWMGGVVLGGGFACFGGVWIRVMLLMMRERDVAGRYCTGCGWWCAMTWFFFVLSWVLHIRSRILCKFNQTVEKNAISCPSKVG